MKAIFYDDLGTSAILHQLTEIYESKVYRPFLYGKKDLNIIDAGANIGMFSLYASPVAKRILAIEPNPKLYGCLEAMIDLNELCNVDAECFALSDKEGQASFSKFPGNATMGCLNPPTGQQWEPDGEVQTRTLSCELLDSWEMETVDLLKLDIEGGEAAVLRSAEFLSASPRIHTIVGEWHEWSGMCKQEFMSRLIEIGYFFRWIPGVVPDLFAATRTLAGICRIINYEDLL